MALKDAGTGTVNTGDAGPGCSASIIGIDTKTVWKALPINVALNTTLTVARIGGGTAALEDPLYAGKALRFQQAAGAVADGAVVANTYLNKTGKALVSGDIVLAVAP